MLYYPSDLMLTETDSAAWRLHNGMKKKAVFLPKIQLVQGLLLVFLWSSMTKFVHVSANSDASYNKQ